MLSFTFCILQHNLLVKRLITILLLAVSCIAFSQSAEPILRIETGMHIAKSNRISTDAAGKYLLTSSQDKTSRLWDASTGTLLKIFRDERRRHRSGPGAYRQPPGP